MTLRRWRAGRTLSTRSRSHCVQRSTGGFFSAQGCGWFRGALSREEARGLSGDGCSGEPRGAGGKHTPTAATLGAERGERRQGERGGLRRLQGEGPPLGGRRLLTRVLWHAGTQRRGRCEARELAAWGAGTGHGEWRARGSSDFVVEWLNRETKGFVLNEGRGVEMGLIHHST